MGWWSYILDELEREDEMELTSRSLDLTGKRYYEKTEADVVIDDLKAHIEEQKNCETQRAKEAIKYRKRIREFEADCFVLRKTIEGNKYRVATELRGMSFNMHEEAVLEPLDFNLDTLDGYGVEVYLASEVDEWIAKQ